MDPRELLREIVAKLTETPAEQIGPDFPLHSHGLQSSGRRAALAAAIRRKIGGIDHVPDSARTFGELEQAVFSPGTPIPLPGPGAPATSRQSAPTSGDNDDQSVRCGLDIENIADLPEAPDYREHEFYQTMFTSDEIAYCIMQENPRMHFAARWCAKEALVKCDPAFRTEKLSSIEVVRQDTGAVFLRHHASGKARKLPHGVSLTHTSSIAAACVVLAPRIPCGVAPH
jgi:phosphopantetheine--protein transferase-like protein